MTGKETWEPITGSAFFVTPQSHPAFVWCLLRSHRRPSKVVRAAAGPHRGGDLVDALRMKIGRELPVRCTDWVRRGCSRMSLSVGNRTIPQVAVRESETKYVHPVLFLRLVLETGGRFVADG